MPSCVFCQIVAGEAPAQVVYRDDDVLAFRDIAPQAPVHILVIPTRHITSMAEIQPSDTDFLGRMLVVAAKIAQQEGLHAGYRLVISTGPQGGQTVAHLHIHILGGRRMRWPPG